MILGLTLEKVAIVAVIAACLLGPRRLPAAAESLGRFVRALRSVAREAAGRLREEVGPEFDDVDWSRLDPRQYDPRRIIRDALITEPEDRIPSADLVDVDHVEDPVAGDDEGDAPVPNAGSSGRE